MKKVSISILAIIFCAFFSSATFAQTTSFQDVTEQDWFYDYVTLLSERFFVSGVNNNEFMPNDDITRAEFVKILANVSQIDFSQYTGITDFYDVNYESWYAKPVQWAYDSQIVQGMGNNFFAPNKKITREEAAVILGRHVNTIDEFQLPNPKEKMHFKDESNISEWAKIDIEKLQLADILCGDKNQNYNPKSNIKRSEACKMIAIYYLYLSGFETQQYIKTHQEELDEEIKAAQDEMEHLANDPSSVNYFKNAPIFNNIISPSGFVGGGFQFLDGDILYTNGTYYFGHIGMACGDRILEIVDSGIRKVTYQTWANRYSDRYTYVLRRIPEYCNGDTNCRQISVNAAWYGQTYFVNGAGRNYSWFLTAPLSSTTIINCSGLAYKCYRDGAGFIYQISVVDSRTGKLHYATPSMITPDDMLNDRVHNGFSAIYKF